MKRMKNIIIDPALPKRLQCVVSDLDGTIIPATFHISERTAQAFERARSMGVITILASGRSPASMRPFWRMLGGGSPYIASNGAQTFDGNGELIREVTIDLETAREVIRFLKSEGIYCQTYYGDCFYHDSIDNPMPSHYSNSTGLKAVRVDDLAGFVDKPVVKILGIDSPENVERLLRLLGARYMNRLIISVSDPHFLEIAPSTASKGAALADLAERMGFQREYTLALGDSLNDVSMLKWAGMSCAIGTCRDEVRDIATWNTGECHDDGAADMINALLDAGFRP